MCVGGGGSHILLNKSLSRIWKKEIRGIKEKYHLWPNQAGIFFLFLNTELIIHGDWITGSICVKIQKHPLGYKAVILGLKPLNSKLNRCAASDSRVRCNFTKASWVSNPSEFKCPEEVIPTRGHPPTPLNDAGVFISKSSFGFLFRVLITNEFISPAYLQI